MKKRLIALLMTVISLVTLITIPGKIKAATLPKLQIVTQPQAEYTKSDKITFTVANLNYTGKVEYRVILYNGTTKTTTNLWNTPSTGYYYRGWQPAGNYKFPITWSASQLTPGYYSMTVLVRRANTNVSYDSYIDTRSFYVKDDTVNPYANIPKEFIPNSSTVRCDNKIKLEGFDNRFFFRPDVERALYAIGTTLPNTQTAGNKWTVDSTLKYMANADYLYHIYYNDKDYVLFLGTWDKIDYENNFNQLTSELKPNDVLLAEVSLCEVFYGEQLYYKGQYEYYFANKIDMTLDNVTIKLIKNDKKGIIPKNCVIPMSIARKKI